MNKTDNQLKQDVETELPAPTGHTLLLLDAAESYHREVLRKPSGSPEAVQQFCRGCGTLRTPTCCS